MDYERISTYLRSLEPSDNELITDIETYALLRQIPIAKRETVSFLETVIKLKKPLRILEVGTCIAYSTIIMAMNSSKAHIDTIEIGDVDYSKAKSNVAKAEEAGLIHEENLNLIKGDATDVLKELISRGEGGYDLIFMDAAKGQYLTWLPDILTLMNDGAVLISDNVFQDENIFESRFAVERRDRTIHKRMREYLYQLKHDESLKTSILPVGDGVAFTVKL